MEINKDRFIIDEITDTEWYAIGKECLDHTFSTRQHFYDAVRYEPIRIPISTTIINVEILFLSKGPPYICPFSDLINFIWHILLVSNSSSFVLIFLQ